MCLFGVSDGRLGWNDYGHVEEARLVSLFFLDFISFLSHSSFCNETEALSLMGLDDIIEAIVKLLWACNSENQTRIPSYTLPHVMTAKYKVRSLFKRIEFSIFIESVKIGSYIRI